MKILTCLLFASLLIPRAGAGEAAGAPAEAAVRIVLAGSAHTPGRPLAVTVEGKVPMSRLLVVDPFGRVLDEADVDPSANGARATLSLARAVCPGAAVELWDARRMLARQSFVVDLAEPLGARYRVVANLWGREATADQLRALRKAGVRTALVNSVAGARALCKEGIWPVAGEAAGEGLLRLSPKTWKALDDRNATERPACLHAPFTSIEAGRKIRAFANSLSGLPLAGVVPVRGPSVGHLSVPHGLCRSPNTLAQFAKELRHRHRTLAALSKSWGGTRDSWQAALPETELAVAARLAPGRLSENVTIAPWLEHRVLCDRALLAATASASAEVRRRMPGVPRLLLGAEAMGAYGPPDLPQLMTSFDISSALLGDFPRSLARSFCPGRGRSLGGPLEPEAGLLAGEIGVLASPAACTSGVGMSLGMRDAFRLQGGLGDLMVNARPMPGPVAVLVSDESAKASHILDRWLDPSAPAPKTPFENMSKTSYMASLAGWADLLDDLGVEYDLVTPGGVARGALRSGGKKALILPRAVAMSPACAGAISDFCKRGGSVIADSIPALMDDAGRRRDLLDDLFGVDHGTLELAERSGRSRPLVSKIVAFEAFDTVGRRRYPRESLAGIPVAVRGVVAKDGPDGATANAAAGDIPCLFARTSGQGKAYYLNLAVSRYTSVRARSGLGLRKIVGFLLDSAGARPSIGIATDAEGEAFGVRTWRLGRLSIYGIWRSSGRKLDRPVRIKVTLPEAAHISEPARGRRLGLRKKFDASVPADSPLILIASPAAERSVELDILSTRGPVEFEASVNMADRRKAAVRVVRVWAESPTGVCPPWYDVIVVVKGEPAGGVIPLCVSDEKGPWKIHARDLASGRETFRIHINR